MKKTIIFMYISLCVLLYFLTSCEQNEESTETFSTNSTIESQVINTSSEELSSETTSSQELSQDVSSQEISSEETSDTSSVISDSTSTEVIDTDAIFLGLYDKYKTYILIYRGRLKYVETEDVEGYFPVDDDRFKTKGDVITFLNTLFTSEKANESANLFFVDNVAAYNPSPYIEKDNMLYILDPYLSMNFYIGYWDIKKAIIEIKENDSIFVTVPVYNADNTDMTHDFYITIINDDENWVIEKISNVKY